MTSCSKNVGMGLGSKSINVNRITDTFDTNSKARDLHVVFLVDTSGSMKDNAHALFDAVNQILSILDSGPFKNQEVKFYVVNAADNYYINKSNDCCSKDCSSDKISDSLYKKSVGSLIHSFSKHTNIQNEVNSLKNKITSFKCGFFESTPAALNVFLKNNSDIREKIKKGYLLAIHLTDEVVKLNAEGRTYLGKPGEQENYIKSKNRYESEQGSGSFENYFGDFRSGDSNNPSPATGNVFATSFYNDILMFRDYIVAQLGYFGSHVGLVQYNQDSNDFYKKITQDTGMFPGGSVDGLDTSAYNLPPNNSGTLNKNKLKEALEIVANKINDIFNNNFVLSKIPKDSKTITMTVDNIPFIQFTYNPSTNSVKCSNSNSCKNKKVTITYEGYDPN